MIFADDIMELEEKITDLENENLELYEEIEKLKQVIKKCSYWCRDTLNKEWLSIFGEPYID